MPRLTVLLVVLCAPSLIAQNIHPTPPPEVSAVPLREEIHLDGKLDEGVWRTAPAATGLRQAQPHEGELATQRTEVRFAFDGAALYVGARMYDDSGARGVRTRLVRRDADMHSDYLEVIFDTYHDHIGRLFFQVNPSGVINDANGLGGGGDPSWDPVWEVKTNIDSLGWTAEMRIPFSQLRFPSTKGEQTWGLQIWRQENRLNELSQWAFWKLNETGGPSKFGHLTGLVITSAPGRAEVLPYVVGRSTNVPGSAGNPFFQPHAMDGRVGVDGRFLLASNLTLNATHAAGFAGTDRSDADRDIFEQLGRSAAGAAGDHGSEMLVLHHAHDHLDPSGHHRLKLKAFERMATLLEGRRHFRGSALDCRRSLQSQSHATCVGFVQDARGHRLERHNRADGPRQTTGFAW